MEIDPPLQSWQNAPETHTQGPLVLAKKSIQSAAESHAQRPLILADRGRSAGQDWLSMKDEIRRLYYDEGLPLRSVRDILARLHNFHAEIGAYKRRLKQWGFAKNGPAAQPGGKRKRPRAMAQPTTPNVQPQRHVVLADAVAVEEGVPAVFRAKSFRHNERLIYSIDSYIRSALDTRNSKGWKLTVTGFQCRSPLYSPSHTITLLRHPSLARKDGYEFDDESFELNLEHFRDSKDPAFLAVFWRICLRLHRAGSRRRAPKELEPFLEEVRDTQTSVPGGTIKEENADDSNDGVSSGQAANALWDLADALLHVETVHVRETLRIGYIKAIDTFRELAGDENIVVLDMITFYCRYFETDVMTKQTLVAKLEYVLHQTSRPSSLGNHRASSPDAFAGDHPWLPIDLDEYCADATTTEALDISPDAAVAVPYSLAYASYFILKDPDMAMAMAEKLREVAVEHAFTTGSDGAPLIKTWSYAAEAFSFSCQVLAYLYRQRVQAKGPDQAATELSMCCMFIEAVITGLERGDGWCIEHAMNLCYVLREWFDEWGLPEAAAEQKARIKNFMRILTGGQCLW